MSGSGLNAFLVAFAWMTLMGYFLTSLLLPRRFSAWLGWALAPATGAGLCSLIDFLFRRPMFTVETFVFIVLFTAWLWRRGWRLPDPRGLMLWRVPLLGVVFAAVLSWSLSEAISRAEVIPYGGWDGWAIWNSHARYIHRDSRQWQHHMFENTFHSDYPLLVPEMAVRLWRFAGEEIPIIGGIFNILFAISGIAILAAALAETGRGTIWFFFALILLSTPNYLGQSTFQEADIPLSVFILSTVALLCLHFERAPNTFGILALSGFMAGCAGWTKNEGLLFILVVSAVLLIPIFRSPATTLRRFAGFGTGLLLPLAVIVFFKATISPQNDIMSNRHYPELIGKVFDSARYMTINRSFLHSFNGFGGWAMPPVVPLLAFLVLKGVSRKTLLNTGWLSGVAIIVLVLAGYYVVYVLTPMDLQWHLDKSLHRLLLHLWSSVLLMAGLATIPRPVTDPRTAPA